MKHTRSAVLTIALVLPSVLLLPSSAHAQTWACEKVGIFCPQSIPGTSSTPEPDPNFVFARSANLTLPNTGAQDDDWSCGPNSAARVLSFYGFDASYNDLRRTVVRLGTFPGSNLLGTAPHELRNAMSRWAGDEVKLERQASFDKLRSLLSEGKPVITLVRVGTIEGNRIGGIGIGGTWPSMHWFVVHGFDEGRRMIYYTDTNGGRDEMPYDEFLSKWGWGIGRGAASSTLAANGVETRTMVWVDRATASNVALLNRLYMRSFDGQTFSSASSTQVSSVDSFRDWSWDGYTASYVIVENGQNILYIRPFDGRTFGNVTSTQTVSSTDRFRGWSWNRNTAMASYVTINDNGGNTLYVRPFDGQRFGNVTSTQTISSTDSIRGWEWDGYTASYVTVQNGRNVLYVRPFDGQTLGGVTSTQTISSTNSIRGWSLFGNLASYINAE
jgi:hypothetical protein